MLTQANIAIDGNSIARGDNSYGQGWAEVMRANLVVPCSVNNYGISGKTTAQILAYSPNALQTLFLRGRFNVAGLFEISNELTSGVGATVAFNNTMTWEANVRAARPGAQKTIIIGCLPRLVGLGSVSAADFESQRQAVRALHLAAYPIATADSLVFANSLGNLYIDAGGEQNIGQPGQSADATKYVDPHLTPLGNTYLEVPVRKGVNQLLMAELGRKMAQSDILTGTIGDGTVSGALIAAQNIVATFKVTDPAPTPTRFIVDTPLATHYVVGSLIQMITGTLAGQAMIASDFTNQIMTLIPVSGEPAFNVAPAQNDKGIIRRIAPAIIRQEIINRG